MLPKEQPRSSGRSASLAVERARMKGSEAARGSSPALPHLRHVEGMRALAALTVFVNHAYAQVWEGPADRGDPSAALAPLSYSLVAGHLAVTVFIVVSGFCLTLPVARGDDRLRGGVAEFLKRRAVRILPPYYASVALSLALIWTVIGEPTGTLWDVPIRVSATTIVAHLVLLQDLFGTGSINYVLWSIAVEWQIYLVFPLLLLSWRKLGPGVTVALAMAAGYAVRMGFDGTRIARTNSHFLGMFALGMLAAYIVCSPRDAFRRMSQSSVWGWISGATFAATILLIGFLEVLRFRFGFIFVDLVVGTMAAAALVQTSRGEHGLLRRFVSWRPLVFVGTFSYSLYLIHAPILQLLWQYVLNPAGLGSDTMFLVLMTAGLAVVLCVAYGFFRAFEEPAMRAASRFRREKAREAVLTT
jgi:peptidoglycan/LPS O-acetylase OafA/YrhL